MEPVAREPVAPEPIAPPEPQPAPVPVQERAPEPVPARVQELVPAADDIDVAQEQFWRRYAPAFNKNTTIGFTTPTFQDYIVERKAGAMHIRSMLTQFELALLYALAKDYYTGAGKIVDLGPLAGVGTNCFARGLSHNTKVGDKKNAIYSYDLFLLAGMTHFLPADYNDGTGSIFKKYLELNADFEDEIVPVPGDFLHMSWSRAPIEILFIDLAKSWKLNAHVVKSFFPHLIPGRSIVVQQDFVHFGEPWVALAMEYFSEYFERLYCMYGATAVYRYVKPIPAEKLAVDFEAMPLEEVDRLFASARAKVTPAIAEVLAIGQARIHLLKNDLPGAVALHGAVNLDAQDGGDVATEFHRAVKANFGNLKREIDRARGQPAA